MSSQLDDMYREIILDHYRAPRGKQPLDRTDIASDGSNPSCGDEMHLSIKAENGVLQDVHVDCKGCAISVASGSMLAETVKGKSFDEVEKLAEEVKKLIKGDSDVIPKDNDDLEALQGVRQFPVRIKCALLAWATLIEGLKDYRHGHKGDKAVSTEEED